MSEPIPAVIAEHIRAINAFDTDAIMQTFAPDAIVNDNRREIAGPDAIRRWVEKEIVGDKVTMQLTISNSGSLPVPWVLVEDLVPSFALDRRAPRLRIKGKRVHIPLGLARGMFVA